MALLFNLLDEPLIRARLVDDGQSRAYSLPGLFAALVRDEVRDFPALRPHQRHPWHAFLVQLAAIALHQAGSDVPFQTENAWRMALLALTPEDPDGAVWCMVTPHDRPAFMQAPVSQGNVSTWKNSLYAADELDMLVTSKNHDLKAARMRRGEIDDWIMSLISLQTQEGFLGSGNYGISRMNGGFASRPAVGVFPNGHWGARWTRDVGTLLETRADIIAHQEMPESDGIALVWLKEWDGTASLKFASLDPFYIEICRRVRLVCSENTHLIHALTTGSTVSRIDAKSRNGLTGDPWTPIDIAGEKALTIGWEGFHYRLAADLLFGSKYSRSAMQIVRPEDGEGGLVVLAQGVTRGQGKTEGYHERRIPISKTVRRLMLENQTDRLAKLAGERVHSIGQVRGVLWTALATLFDQGASKDKFSDSAKDKASVFVKAYEQAEDARFFDDLNEEIESDQPSEVHLRWLLSSANRAEKILIKAFSAGPRSCVQLYRARSAALSRFHGGLRNSKTLPVLAEHFRQQALNKELSHDLG